MKKNLFALAFVVLTQGACVAYYSIERPASYGKSNFDQMERRGF